MSPRPFRVERSRTIAAPRAQVAAEIVDFRRWTAWSPWEDADPAMTREYSGAAEGIGARYRWSGNRRAGEGSMEIVGRDATAIDIRLVFTRPMAADNAVRFDRTDDGTGTRVTWSMSGGDVGPRRGLLPDRADGPTGRPGLRARVGAPRRRGDRCRRAEPVRRSRGPRRGCGGAWLGSKA